MSEKKELKAIYSGKLPIGGLELDCYVLNDDKNTRILSAKSIFTAFDRPTRGNRERDTFEYKGELIQLPPFLASKALYPLINSDLLGLIQKIEFIDGTIRKTGYDANILPAMCELYMRARREKKLAKLQLKLATQAEILQSAFARVGIQALIDEATGFQYDRKNDALRYLLQQYIAEGLQKWIKTFPDEFFDELNRLYENETMQSNKRPQYYGKFINTYIYEPLENGYIKAELDKKNITDDGKRKARFHQWLTKFGKEQLTKQIWKVLGAMQVSTDLENAKFLLAKQAGMTTFSKDLFETKEVIVKPQKQQKIKENQNVKTAEVIKDIQENPKETQEIDIDSTMKLFCK